MVRALGNASPREHAGAGSDSGLGEEQPELQACQSLLPQQADYHLSTATSGHSTTDDKEENDDEFVADNLLPDFSCLAVATSQPPRSEQNRQQKLKAEFSEKAGAQTVTIESLSRNGPPAECAPHLSNLLIALAKQNLRLLHSLKQSNLVLSKLERDASYFEEKKNAPDNTNGEIKPTKKDKKENLKKVEAKNGTDANHSLHNLSQQLDVAEEAQAQLSQDLQRMTREKLEIQNQLALVRGEQDQHQATVEQLTKEKWELSAANTDLQQRLQQTVTLAHMQAEGNQSRLQEEVGRMMFQLEEERKVTANLSRTLELEKRKVESLEQKAKCGSSKMSQSSRGERRRSSLLPEEVRECETRLSQSMEVYRQRCDNLGVSLEGVQARLEEERYRGDLTTEVNKLRSLLTQEKKKMYTETTRLAETSQLFEQVYLDYVAVMEGIKTASHEKKMKSQQQAVLSNIAESNMRDNVDSMTARLMQAEQALSQERKASQAMRERLEKAALDLEALPLLQAQVEVYQSDFNAERTARERIAGEKADLEEQLRKMGNDGLASKGGGTAGRRGGGGTNNVNPINNGGGGVVGRRRDGSIGGRGDQLQHGGEVADAGRRDFTAHDPPQIRQDHNIYNNAAQYDNIPRTVNTRPDPPAPDTVGAEPEAFTCPKCNKEFRNMTLLTRHVNDCLDRDF